MLASMPRNLRVVYAGAHYHVFSRGNQKKDIYRCDLDRRVFLKRLAATCQEFACRCLAYCLMDNHYHLVLRTDEPLLSSSLQAINARYAEHFNLAYGQIGHVFQGRFHAKPIESERYLYQVIRYVLLNPVSAGLCASPAAWQWSSYGAVVGTRTHRDWFDRRAVLMLFGEHPGGAIARFEDFILAGERVRPTMTPSQYARFTRDDAIRAAYATGAHTVRSLASEFSVSRATVARIVSNGV
jgi:REP element-mobilizing transposase RayT